ncbi:hypothetical protein TrVE_jg12258 [Triparma verrucosa]|nr:hypothetical protein TrVE_jg12258 [Triparma verrucosa]
MGLNKNPALQPILLLPILFPITSFLFYTPIASGFRTLLEVLNTDRNWIPVDGGAYQIEILTPSINGIVLPSLCILFATLVSTTITQLRDRQLAVRTCLNIESSDLSRLSLILSMIDSCSNPEECETSDNSDRELYSNLGSASLGRPMSIEEGVIQTEKYSLGSSSRVFLRKYVVSLIKESRPGSSGFFSNSATSTPMSSNELNTISSKFYTALSAGTCEMHIADTVQGIVCRLIEYRSRRISSLQTTFPPLHYGILSLLALSISSCFLLETDQEALAFLNALQLKILFTMLVGTFSSLAVVCVDLSDPFGGSYSIGSTVLQLFSLRDSFNENALADVDDDADG